jgi:hypothetical protein
MPAPRILFVLPFLVSCGGGAASEPAPPAEPPPVVEASSGDEDEEPTISDHMRHHFGVIVAARDAVIRGDAAGVHEPMRKLYEGDYGIEIPQDWMSSLNEVQTVADRGRNVDDLHDAGRLVAMISRQCGECHRTFGRPEHIAERQEYAAEGAGLHEAMARHMWAAEQMWLGITTPSHEAWIRGANAISETWSPTSPTSAGAGDEATSKDSSTDRMIQAIRARGPVLREAQTSHARAEAYGELIADCGGCHVAAGIQLPK